MAVSLVSLNIEGSKHLDSVEAFLRERNPEVVCLQELCEYDIPRFEALLGTSCYFAPMMNLPAGSPLSMRTTPALIGVGVFSRLPVTRQVTHYYHQAQGELQEFDETDTDAKRRTQHCLLVVSDIEKDEEVYRIGTTHFTWTPKGDADEYQRTDVKEMLSIIATEAPMLFCGDFNAPRGGEIFKTMATAYRDNIPPQYETSIDISLHRSGKERPHELVDKMVDGLFTSPEYRATDVDLVFGISDHAAIVASISKEMKSSHS